MSSPARTDPPAPEVLGRLDLHDVQAVRALVEAATSTDGTAPLSEHVLLHLAAGGDAATRNLVIREGRRVVAYAHLDVTDAVEGSSAEVVVAPAARGQGLGRALVQAVLGQSPDGRLRLWAHADLPAATGLAESMGFRRSRVLFQMRRSLAGEPFPEVRLPDGVSVRTFEVGQDEQAWTELNNRAFVEHPDQGGWSLEEISLREREPWFDPTGFFLAERGGRLVGSHWTKVHGGHEPHDHDVEPHTHPESEHHDHPPIGEVYIVAVDPSEQGHGLGPALTLLGLHSLRARGLDSVLLYVDESNTAAVRVYERLGFTRYATDVMHTRG